MPQDLTFQHICVFARSSLSVVALFCFFCHLDVGSDRKFISPKMEHILEKNYYFFTSFLFNKVKPYKVVSVCQLYAESQQWVQTWNILQSYQSNAVGVYKHLGFVLCLQVSMTKERPYSTSWSPAALHSSYCLTTQWNASGGEKKEFAHFPCLCSWYVGMQPCSSHTGVLCKLLSN